MSVLRVAALLAASVWAVDMPTKDSVMQHIQSRRRVASLKRHVSVPVSAEAVECGPGNGVEFPYEQAVAEVRAGCTHARGVISVPYSGATLELEGLLYADELHVHGNDDVEVVSVASLQELGTLSVADNGWMTSVQFPSLTSADLLSITNGNDTFSEIAFLALQQVGRFETTGHSLFSRLDLSSLEELDSFEMFEIEFGTAADIDLSSLHTITGDFSLYVCTRDNDDVPLVSFSFPKLHTADYVAFVFNDILTDLTFPALQRIGRLDLIEDEVFGSSQHAIAAPLLERATEIYVTNGALVTASFPVLHTVDSHFFLVHCTALTELDARALRNVGEEVRLTDFGSKTLESIGTLSATTSSPVMLRMKQNYGVCCSSIEAAVNQEPPFHNGFFANALVKDIDGMCDTTC